jgi:hypothetical protein
LEEEKLNIISLPVEDDKEIIPEMDVLEAEQGGKEYEVETKNLSVSFNGRPAISDINLSVRKQTANCYNRTFRLREIYLSSCIEFYARYDSKVKSYR